jgi:hypothetical protein
VSTIRINCPHCGMALDADSRHAGTAFNCPGCGQTGIVPNSQPEGDIAMQNVATRGLLHLCLSILCLAVSAFMVLSIVNMRRVSDAAVSYLDNARAIQTSLSKDAAKYGEVVSELALYAATIPLEEGQILGSYDAGKLREESLATIKTSSPRWGKIADAVHTAIQREREKTRRTQP